MNSPFTPNSRSVHTGTEIRQSLLGDRPFVAGSGSALEAILMAEVHWLRATPGFLGAATSEKEAQDLITSVDEPVVLVLVDSIAPDAGLSLLQSLAHGPHPPPPLPGNMTSLLTLRQPTSTYLTEGEREQSHLVQPCQRG